MFGSFNFEKKIGMDKNTKSKLFFFFLKVLDGENMRKIDRR